MCLIIFRQKDQNLTKEFFQNVATRNSDGWGIMWVSGKGEKRRVKTACGMEFNKFWANYTSLQANNIPCLIHFRMNTHGETSLAMCHPFEVAEGVYMMHNGVVDVAAIDYDKTKSDTWAFSQLVVRPMLANRTEPLNELIRSDWFKLAILKLIGTGNRMVFLDKDGPVAIDTKNWSKTTGGVVVSNPYAYTVDNPTYKPSTSRYNAYDDYADYDYSDYRGGGYYKSGIWYPAPSTTNYSGYNRGNTSLNAQPTTAVATVQAVTAEVVKEEEKKEEVQSKLIHMFTKKAEEANSSEVDTVDDYDSDQKKEFDLTEQYEDIIRFITLDSAYAEEVVYQDPETAIEVLKYLAEDY